MWLHFQIDLSHWLGFHMASYEYLDGHGQMTEQHNVFPRKKWHCFHYESKSKATLYPNAIKAMINSKLLTAGFSRFFRVFLKRLFFFERETCEDMIIAVVVNIPLTSFRVKYRFIIFSGATDTQLKGTIRYHVVNKNINNDFKVN